MVRSLFMHVCLECITCLPVQALRKALVGLATGVPDGVKGGIVGDSVRRRGSGVIVESGVGVSSGVAVGSSARNSERCM